MSSLLFGTDERYMFCTNTAWFKQPLCHLLLSDLDKLQVFSNSASSTVKMGASVEIGYTASKASWVTELRLE